ncbi:hypothetical protein MetMK1DRAFT_00004370 [Metallosphaera yellowstonensis MK1]|uniref:Uncharacterized protein n=1 Tax=Metallosphaera yellowstonensis MK1 TaxID=671065 RepID=H2C0Y6_9CREN|nr:hypothetical protein [Metallosphaera yellowstonensis]EHP69935.1 hypothetical protein MetMK1DRAFT_00004370 [Metallosphaera yellowstonensis MK1]
MCGTWKLSLQFEDDVTSLRALSDLVAEEFPMEEVAEVFLSKLRALMDDPTQLAKNKVGGIKDTDGRPLFYVKITSKKGLMFSYDSETCTVFIWRFGNSMT